MITSPLEFGPSRLPSNPQTKKAERGLDCLAMIQGCHAFRAVLPAPRAPQTDLTMKILLIALATFIQTFWNTAAAHNVETYIAEKGGQTAVVTGVSHTKSPEIWPPSENLWALFEKSDLALNELDTTNAEQVKELARRSQSGSNTPASKYFSPDELKEIAALLAARSGSAPPPVEKVSSIDSCLLGMATFPASPIEFDKADKGKVANTPSYESFFLNKAKELGKKTGSLEPDGGLGACEKLSPADVRSFFQAGKKLNSTSELRDAYFSLKKDAFQKYVDGDGEAFYAKSIASFDFEPAYRSAFVKYIDSRNQAMLKTMLADLRDVAKGHSIFVTVGTLHLYGNDGLLKLLERDGFKISPMPKA